MTGNGAADSEKKQVNESGSFWNHFAGCNSDRPRVRIESATQDWGVFRLDAAEVGTPLTLNGKTFRSGFGTHADSRIVLRSEVPMARFRAVVGIDGNPDTVASPAELEFRVAADGRTLAKTGYLGLGQAETLDIALPPETRTLELEVRAKDGRLYLAHADWCEVTLSDAAGRVFRLEDEPFEVDTLPVSFVYGDRPSAELLREWGIVCREETTSDGRRKLVYVSRDPEDGFECRYELEEYPGVFTTAGRRGRKCFGRYVPSICSCPTAGCAMRRVGSASNRNARVRRTGTVSGCTNGRKMTPRLP